MSQGGTKNILFLIIVGAVAFFGYNILMHPEKASDSYIAVNSNESISKTDSLDLKSNVNSSENKNGNTLTVEIKTEKYAAQDGSWSVNYDQSLKVSELNNQVEFKSDKIKIVVNTGDQKIDKFNGYTEVLSEPVTVSDLKIDKKTYDSRDHVAGYPTERILVVNLPNQQLVAYYAFGDEANSKSMNSIFDSFIKDFRVK
ncbi:MAG: hypothetical protein WCW17_00120 [Patescibacteria group bacterium]|jgi:hypothetical protein